MNTEQPTDLEAMRQQKDGAYFERNQVVAALAKCFPSGVAKTAIEGWSEDWHGCVYIDLPTGQVSWHFHDSQAYLFKDLPPYAGAWDGHDTPEKYRRVNALSAWAGLNPAEYVRASPATADFDLPAQSDEVASKPLSDAWQEGYKAGVEDERISESNIDIAGYGAKVNPARQNPYGTKERG